MLAIRGAFSRFFAESGLFLAAGLAFFFLICCIPMTLLGTQTEIRNSPAPNAPPAAKPSATELATACAPASTKCAESSKWKAKTSGRNSAARASAKPFSEPSASRRTRMDWCFQSASSSIVIGIPSYYWPFLQLQPSFCFV